MPTDDRDLVEVVEVGLHATGTPRGATDQDVLASAGGRVSSWLQRRRWWRGASPVGRRMATAAVVLSAAAVVAGLAAVEQPRRVERVTRTVVVPAVASGVDALGCPVGRTCAIRAPVATVAAIRRRLPAARVLAATEVFDVGTGVVYRREVVAHSDRPAGTLRLVAQCEPGAGRMAGESLTWRHLLDAATLAQVVVVERLVGTGTGCTSYVMAEEPDPGGSTQPQLGLQVAPLAVDSDVRVPR